jgi:hypothetical protein
MIRFLIRVGLLKCNLSLFLAVFNYFLLFLSGLVLLKIVDTVGTSVSIPSTMDPLGTSGHGVLQILRYATQ